MSQKKQPPVYDRIGQNYNNTRKADPYITERLYHLLQPKTNGLYIDIGCGTGNYYKALTDRDLHFVGVDPSETMLNVATQYYPNGEFLNARAEELPFEDNKFDGAIAVFSLHHWENLEQGLSEAYRVLKPGANFVMLSFTPEQVNRYWLRHYFPDMIKSASKDVLDKTAKKDLLGKVGFTNVKKEKYFIHDELTDHFLFSNKYKPERYLDPIVRSGMASFRLYTNEAELTNGLRQLETDISTGFIRSIIENHENGLGDYLFYCATK